MDDESFMVFEQNGNHAEWEQVTISLSFKKAKDYLEYIEVIYPNKCYIIFKRISYKEA